MVFLRQTLLFLLAVLIHEGGHIFAMLLCGVRPKGFSGDRAGLVMTYDEGSCTLRERVFIYGAGSLFNLIFSRLSPYCLLLGAFNLLPAAALDGGNILRTVISEKLGTAAAEKALKFTTLLSALCMTVLGMTVFIMTGTNVSLLFLSWWAVISSCK